MSAVRATTVATIDATIRRELAGRVPDLVGTDLAEAIVVDLEKLLEAQEGFTDATAEEEAPYQLENTPLVENQNSGFYQMRIEDYPETHG